MSTDFPRCSKKGPGGPDKDFVKEYILNNSHYTTTIKIRIYSWS